MSDTPHIPPLKTTPLDVLHRELGAKMVPFAGYDMPVHYKAGILKEHLHTRTHASLFDVSHMGQAFLRGQNAAKAFEKLVPGDYQGMAKGRTRYSLLTNEQGGILDDLMATQLGGDMYLVVNAACKEQDFAHIARHIGDGVSLEVIEDRALLALQGPEAETVLARLCPPARDMAFMSFEKLTIGTIACFVTRSGYTGEDGYEISLPADRAQELARMLLDEPEVAPAGLGARDSLRLEAGLCLYGHDIDQNTTPSEAGLNWVIGKRRREEGGFPGADIIVDQIKNGVTRKRVGILPEGRAPAREHSEIQDMDAKRIGEVTSGGFGPSLGGPLAMGYVDSAFAAPGTPVQLIVRAKTLPAKIVKMPFVAHRYKIK